LTKNATLGEITSLEELVSLLMQKNAIPAATMQALWDIFGTFFAIRTQVF
jgi:hypothetical protein